MTNICNFDSLMRQSYEYEGRNPHKILESCIQMTSLNLNSTEMGLVTYRHIRYCTIIGDNDTKSELLSQLFRSSLCQSNPFLKALHSLALAEHYYEQLSDGKIKDGVALVEQQLVLCRIHLGSQIDKITFLTGKYFFLKTLLHVAKLEGDQAYASIEQAKQCFEAPEVNIPYLAASCRLVQLQLFKDWDPNRYVNEFHKRDFENYPILVYRGLSDKLRLLQQLAIGVVNNEERFKTNILIKNERNNLKAVAAVIMQNFTCSTLDERGNFLYQQQEGGPFTQSLR